MRRLSKWPWALSSEPCAMSNGPTRLGANDTFRRFKPEQTHEVRKPVVTDQSYIERARKARQMLRSMTTDQLLQVIEFYSELNFFEAFALAKRENKLVVPNAVHDKVLTEITDDEPLRQLYHVWKWTGTLVIYEKPNKKFGKNVSLSWEYEKVKYSVLFSIPKQFKGKRNCALAMEHPDFEVIDLGNNRFEIKLVEGANIHLIANFPKQTSQRYKPHPETKIPQGEPVKNSKDARYLWRLDSAFIGPVARNVIDDRRRYIGALYRPSIDFGVAFVSLASVPSSQ